MLQHYSTCWKAWRVEPQQSTAAAETGAEKRRLAMAAKTAAVLKIANSLTLDTIPSASLNEYRDLFDRIDEDGSGLVEPPELKQQFAKIGLDIDGENFEALLSGLDQDKSGEVDFEEFVTVLHAFVLQQRDVADLQTYANFGIDEIAPEFYGSPMSRLQHKAWIALEQPSSSTLATCISVAIMSLIFASTVSFVLETDPNLRTQEHAAGFAIIETISVIAFTIEYFLRLLVCPDKATFLKSKLNGVDLCAILPFYIEKMMASSSLKGSQVLRVIRLVRVFRLMKISRYLTWLRVFGNTLRLSVAPLGMILFITLIATVVFSSAIFVSERGVTAGEGSSSLIPFDSIPTSFWWCVVTMTTVGYGDMVPQTLWGKLVAVVTAFSGILILAIPISVIAANFHTEYQLSLTTKQLSSKLSQSNQELDEAQQASPEFVHWSQGYLKSSLDLILTNRQRITTGMKTIEAANRVEFKEGFSTIAELLCETADAEMDPKLAQDTNLVSRRSSLGSVRSVGSNAVLKAVSAAKRSMRRMSTTGISAFTGGHATSFDAAGAALPQEGIWSPSDEKHDGFMSARSSAKVHTDVTVQSHLADCKR